MTTPDTDTPRSNPGAAYLARAADAAVRDVWTRTDPAGAWRVVVTPPPGKAARGAVRVFLPADADAPAVLDVLDLIQTAPRAKLEAATAAAGLADVAGAGFADALRALGAQLADRPRGGGTDAPATGAGGGVPVVLADAEPWPDPVDGAAVLAAVAAFVAGHVALPPAAADVCALWLAYTYVFDVWPVAAYLLVLSPARGCGKSTLLDVLAALARRPLAAADTSPAALYRALAKWRPTLFLDEVDEWLAAKRDDGFAGLLNAGTRAGGQAMRCVGEGAAQDVAGFDVFGPKLLAGIAPPLPDATRSRCLAIRLERAGAAELARLAPFSAYDRPAAAPLAAQLARWTADARGGAPGATAGGALLAERPPLPPGLAGRAGEPWAPLFAIADAAGDRWPAAVRAAVAALAPGDGGADEARDMGELLLSHIAEYLATHAAVDADAGLVRSAALLEWLRADDFRPWATVPKPDGLNAHALARHLRRWRVPPKQRRAGEKTVRGFDRDALVDAVARYVTPPPGEAGQVGQARQVGRGGVYLDAGASEIVPVVPLVPVRPACPGPSGAACETRAAAVRRVVSERPGLTLTALAAALGCTPIDAEHAVNASRRHVVRAADGRFFLTSATADAA